MDFSLIKSVVFQFSANQSKCIPQLHYANSQGLNHGQKRILYLLLVMDENRG
jgi:hypothetical protein